MKLEKKAAEAIRTGDEIPPFGRVSCIGRAPRSYDSGVSLVRLKFDSGESLYVNERRVLEVRLAPEVKLEKKAARAIRTGDAVPPFGEVVAVRADTIPYRVRLYFDGCHLSVVKDKLLDVVAVAPETELIDTTYGDLRPGDVLGGLLTVQSVVHQVHVTFDSGTSTFSPDWRVTVGRKNQ